MRLAQPCHKELVLNILSRSFQANRSVNYVVKQDEYQESRIRRLMEYSYNVCNAFGEVWLSDDRQACALILLPEKKKTTLKAILWDIKLAFTVIGLNRVMKVMEREGLIKKNYPKDPICYLWFIGVNPQHQSRGIGSSLLKEVLAECDRKKRAVYLETSVDKNIRWYRNFGFEIYNSLELTYTLYLLRRQAA